MISFFEILNQETKYDLDLNSLEHALIEAQKQFHPDNLIEAGQEATQTIHMSALINQAYTTLKDPLKRAIYLLSSEGITLDNRTMSPEFLMQQMDFRERIEDKEDLSIEIQSQMNHRYTELGNIFKKIELKHRDPESLNQAVSLVLELQFFAKL